MRVFVKRISKGVASREKRISSEDTIEIDVMTSSTSTTLKDEDGEKYSFFELSPYRLTDENGIFFENLWQFSKVFLNPIPVKEKLSKYNPFVVWEYSPPTPHLNTKTLLPTEEWWEWRNRGFFNAYPVRYPNSYSQKSKVAYTYWSGDYLSPPSEENKYLPLSYIRARKDVYLSKYTSLIEDTREFAFLKKISLKKDIIIREVDCFYNSDRNYYLEKYPSLEDTISEDGLFECSVETLKIMLNDSLHSFGHGYGLAAHLLGVTEKLS